MPSGRDPHHPRSLLHPKEGTPISPWGPSCPLRYHHHPTSHLSRKEGMPMSPHNLPVPQGRDPSFTLGSLLPPWSPPAHPSVSHGYGDRTWGGGEEGGEHRDRTRGLQGIGVHDSGHPTVSVRGEYTAWGSTGGVISTVVQPRVCWGAAEPSCAPPPPPTAPPSPLRTVGAQQRSCKQPEIPLGSGLGQGWWVGGRTLEGMRRAAGADPVLPSPYRAPPARP